MRQFLTQNGKKLLNIFLTYKTFFFTGFFWGVVYFGMRRFLPFLTTDSMMGHKPKTGLQI
jgi:hypothetical protein